MLTTMATYSNRNNPVHSSAWSRAGRIISGAESVADAMSQAGLNWDVRLSPVHDVNPITGVVSESDQMFAVYRVPRAGGPSVAPVRLGYVGPDYEPVQNEQVFSFLDEMPNSRFVSAGSFRDGAIVWAMVEINGLRNMEPVRGDSVSMQFLVTNSHNGSRVLSINASILRLVCINGLVCAEHVAGGRFKHTRSITNKLQTAANAVKYTERAFESTRDRLAKFAAHRMPGVEFSGLLEHLYPHDVDAGVRTLKPQRSKARAIIIDAYDHGPGAAMAGHTAWGALNAVTYYTNHMLPVRGETDRAESLWFGHGSGVSAKAYEYLDQLVG